MGKAWSNSSLPAFAIAAALTVAGCSGSSNSGDPVGTAPPPPSNNNNNDDSGCTGACVASDSFLTTADVQRVIAQGVAEAAARGKPGTIAVVDRVGNVLGVYKMTGAPITVQISSNRGVVGGLEGLGVPTELAAIAKAVTGAYLSSEGNAFSTRTASQIVQQTFNPGESNAPSGPLFGVQFSQLSCSDLNLRAAMGTAGPQRSPLGLSADPGGFPLYKNGVPIGGVGFAGGDAQYTLDPVISDRDLDTDELVALGATFGYAAPLDRQGDRITADGKTFRFSDARFTDLTAANGALGNLGTAGAFATVPFYFNGTVRPGTVFGSALSGIRADTTRYPGRDAFVLVDSAGAERFAPRAGTTGAGALSAEEARIVVDEALGIANRARAQIRRPLSTPVRVSISVVDTNGVVLALARTRDAPVFGLDVSLQKARTAAFFSGNFAAAELQGRIPTQYFSVALQPNATAPTTAAITISGRASIGEYVTRLREFLGQPTALGDGAIAYSDRAIGNLARPFYPDGIVSAPPGPFSRSFDQWSPFHVGLQLDLSYTALAFSVVHYLDALGLRVTLEGAPLPSPFPDPPQGTCTGITKLGNGIQIFPGGVPIYRGNVLVGAIGISGDGVDQDDMVAFLGLHNAGVRLNNAIGNAPTAIRADNLVPDNARLRYVQCPQSPFINSDEQNVCGGK